MNDANKPPTIRRSSVGSVTMSCYCEAADVLAEGLRDDLQEFRSTGDVQ